MYRELVFLSAAAAAVCAGCSTRTVQKPDHGLPPGARWEWNATRVYQYKYLDHDELTGYKGDEVFEPLYRELRKESEKGCFHRLQGQYCFELCLALIDKCQSKGVAALLELFKESLGKEVKGTIASALAARQRDETIPALLEGIREEGQEEVLIEIDHALGGMTTTSRYGETLDNEEAYNWWKMSSYWHVALRGTHLPHARPDSSSKTKTGE